MADKKKTAAGSSLVVLLLLVGLALFKFCMGGGGEPQGTGTEPTNKGDRRRGDIARTRPAEAGDYLFCFWNVENYFDDVDDGRKRRDDQETVPDVQPDLR